MVHLWKKNRTTTSFIGLILCAYVLMLFSPALMCMEDEHKEPYKKPITTLQQKNSIRPLQLLVQNLYKRVPQNPTSAIRSQITADFLLKALHNLNQVTNAQHLIHTLTALLDDQTNSARLEPRIVTLVAILSAHTKLHPHVTKAHELMFYAFEQIYNTENRNDPYKISPKNSVLGAAWVLEIATIFINHKPVLYTISQSLYDSICADAQNPEKLIHIIQYFFDHGFSSAEIITFFEDHDIDIEDAHRDYSDGATPLILACANGFHAISKFLIDAGTLITTSDHAKNTALHYAVSDGNIPTIELLCQCGAENTPNQVEAQPSTMALQLSDERPVRHTATILESLLPKTIIDDTDAAILQNCCEELYFYLCTQCLAYLSPQPTVLALSYVSNWFQPNIMITYAGCHGYNRIIRILGQTDTDLNTVDDYKKTAMDYALENRQLQTVELLKQLGYERSLSKLWTLLSSSPHAQQTFDSLHNSLYHLLILIVKKYVSVATATLILAYINPLFDITFYPQLGANSAFTILGPFAQGPYFIDEGIQKILTPHDQSTTLLNSIGTWIRTMAIIDEQYSDPNNPRKPFNPDVADIDGTTAFDLAIKTGSWPKAHILAMAGSRPDPIKALHGLINYMKQHPADQTLSPKKLLELIALLSGVSVKNIDQAHHHNEFIMPMVYRFLPLLSRPKMPQANNPVLQELDDDLATTLEIQHSIPTFQGIALPLIGIIASYLLKPLTHQHCS